VGDVEEEVVRQSLIALALLSGCRPPESPALSHDPPPAPRELRAAWVATVANIDWPSKKGLSTDEQRAEITVLLDRARELHLNAIMLQVRPSADTIHPSEHEPWSEFLTGQQGRAPDPPYDPLATWIDEAHRRGIELHAWFNPYRARHKDATSPNVAPHVAVRRPEIVKSYGGFLWMDPGAPGAADETMTAILDVVRRYDVDGVHIDDYFYPYPVTEGAAEIDFPDAPSWDAYVAGGGTLPRADWRRKNVTDLVERIAAGVHAEKRYVRFGVSPFGIGRPDRRPPAVRGFSQYDKLYADVETWLERGTLDYLAPQLYWPMASTGQPFGVLLEYWIHESRAGRPVFPGLFTSRIEDGSKSPWSSTEVEQQIDRTRQATSGHLHFSMRALLENRGHVADRLRGGAYANDAVVPAMPWIDTKRPERPMVTTAGSRIEVRAWGPIAKWLVWEKTARTWRFRTEPAQIESFEPSRDAAEVVVSMVDRTGNESPRVRLEVKR
jgi:uncharacterized lipoprotein YddW (UPF0748 family)